MDKLCNVPESSNISFEEILNFINLYLEETVLSNSNMPKKFRLSGFTRILEVVLGMTRAIPGASEQENKSIARQFLVKDVSNGLQTGSI